MRIHALVAVACIAPAIVIAAAPPEDKCEVAQHAVAARLAACRHKAKARAIKAGVAADYARCDASFAKKWAKAAAAAAKKGATCRYDEDGSELQAFVESHTDTLTGAFSGTGLPVCGDGVLDVAGEQCDGLDLGGETCVGLGFVSGTLACDVACLLDTSACVPICAGSTNCSGTCVQTDSDNLHCGGCGAPCGAGTRCESGVCVPA